MRKTFSHIGLFCCIVVVCACARQPTPTQAGKLMQRYFTHYAKKYPSVSFGQSPATDVQVTDMEELHKYRVSTTANVTFHDGRTASVRCTLDKRLPRGWKVVSWERLGNSTIDH